jgi:hypothetical protein
LLIISSHLSLVFKFPPRMCHPITKTLKSSNNNQSPQKKNQKFKSPQQYWLPPLPKNFKLP